MKQKFKNYLKLGFFTLVLSLISVNCVKDQDIFIENETSFKTIDVVGQIVKGDSIRQTNKNLDLFLRLRFEARNRFSSEDITSNIYGFTVLTDRIFQLNGENYTNYIFNITRNNSTIAGFENYMLTIFNDGSYMQVLIYYPFINNDNQLEADINGATVTYINDESLLTNVESSPCNNASEEIIAWEEECVAVNCGDKGDHSPGEACDNGDYVAYWNCTGAWVVTGCIHTGNGSSSSGSNTNDPFPPTGNGGNSTNPSDPNTPDETVPTIPFIPAPEEIENCLNNNLNTTNLLSNEDRTWLNDRSNSAQVNLINDYLQNNGCNDETMTVANEIIGECQNDGEFDDEEILKAVNFKGTKADCVYKKLKNSSNGFKAMIKKFEESFPVAHLKFETDPTMSSNSKKAYTNPPENYIIDIVINGNAIKDASYQKRPNLLVAKTIIHEVIHAEMFRKLLSLAQVNGEIDVPNIQNMLQQGDYPGMLDYYVRHGNSINSNWQHAQMAAHYRTTIARALQEFDTGMPVPDNVVPQQIYLDLSWEGLNHSIIPAWQDLTTPEEKARIDQAIDDYINAYPNQNCTE